MTVVSAAPGTRLAPYRVAALGATAVSADVAFDPVHRHVPLCPFHAITGAWCPLCGGLRAVDSLAHLNLTAALHDNLVLVALLPVVAVWWTNWALRSRVDRRPVRLSGRYVVAFVALAVVFTVVRNLPFAGGLRPT
jgi:uncharacterized protein DUF2752